MKTRSKPKQRVSLPFVAPEEHYATKTDIAKVETKLTKQISDAKAQIIMWVAGLQLASIAVIVAFLK